MLVGLLGLVRVVHGEDAIELEVPAEGAPLSWILRCLLDKEPRLTAYLPHPPAPAALRVVLNGDAVVEGQDPTVCETDNLLLLIAVAGGALDG